MFSLITTSVLVGITGIIGVGGGGSYIQVGVTGASAKTALQPARRKANTRIHNERKYPLNLALYANLRADWTKTVRKKK